MEKVSQEEMDRLIPLFKEFQNQQLAILMTNFLTDNTVFNNELKPVLFDVLTKLAEKKIETRKFEELLEQAIRDCDIEGTVNSQIDDITNIEVAQIVQSHFNKNEFDDIAREIIEERIDDQVSDYDLLTKDIIEDRIEKDCNIQEVLIKTIENKIDQNAVELIAPSIETFLLSNEKMIESILSNIYKKEFKETIERISITSFLVQKLKRFFTKALTIYNKEVLCLKSSRCKR